MSVEQHTVEYRPIQGFPGYRVGDDGSVWSCRKRGGILREEWKRLSEKPDAYWGRVRVSLRGAAGGKRMFSSTLVLEAFVGPRPDGMECCHNNGNSADNRLVNLRWDTKESNMADKIRHGTHARGERNSEAKLTEQQVIEIRKLRGVMVQREIAKRYGVERSTVGYILTGKLWKHLPAV